VIGNNTLRRAFFALMAAWQHFFLATVMLIFLPATCVQQSAAAESMMGQTHHRYPALRQFWREVEEEAEEELEELEPSWFRQEHVTDKWMGQRSTLVSWGITPTLTYVSDILGNPVGGQHKKVAYDDNIGLDIDADLESLAGLTDLTFHVSGSMRSGRNLSAVAVGNTFSVSNIFGGETIRFYVLYLEQSFLEDTVNVMLGRFGVGDEFLTSPLYSVFLNNAIDGNPISVPLNIPTFSSAVYPVAQWGLRVTVKPERDWYVMAAISNGDPTLARNSAHGVDFSFHHNAAVFAIGEIGHRHNQTDDSPGLPGNYKFGGYYDSGLFTDLSRGNKGGAASLSGLLPRKEHNNYGFYLLVDQEVYRETDPKHVQGLTPFAGVTFAPPDFNTFPFFFMAGLVYTGLIPGRDRDTVGFGIAYGQFSNDLRRTQRAQPHRSGSSASVQEFEMILELTYQIELAPHLIVQPDMQYIIQPGGTGHIPDAFVLGVQFAVNL
jgi:porin